MKILSILAIVFSFTQCGTTKFETNPPFSIKSAEYYGWTGGQPGISGINVKIQLEGKSAIEFDSLYFKNKSTKIIKKDASLLVANFNTSKNIPADVILDIDPKKELKNEIPKPKKTPFELKDNEAVISYKLGGKTRYFKISDLKKSNTDKQPKIQ